MSGTAVLCKPEGDAFDELSSFVLDSAVLSQSGRLQHCARNGHVVFAPWRTGSAVAVGSKRIRSYLHQRRQEEAGIPFICLRTVDQAQIPGSCQVAYEGPSTGVAYSCKTARPVSLLLENKGPGNRWPALSGWSRSPESWIDCAARYQDAVETMLHEGGRQCQLQLVPIISARLCRR